MKNKKRNFPNALLNIAIIILAVMCIVFFCYSPFIELINSINSTKIIKTYKKQTESLNDEEIGSILKDAYEYNDFLKNNVRIKDRTFHENEYKAKPYDEILNMSTDGIIGIVTVPSIDIKLPIYHGTSEEVLDKGIIHLKNTSFPVGGTGTHAVLSGHTAYPGKIFFDRLPEAKEGEYVYITILGHIYSYKICNIYVVLPEDMDKYSIEKDRDIITLMTCTPYSINTHRLLVRAERDLEAESEINEKSENNRQNQLEIISNLNYYILVKLIFMIIGIIAVFILASFISNNFFNSKQQKKGYKQ